MPDILHRIAIKSQPSETFKALATLPGLGRWWTGDTTGDEAVGGVIHFRFGDRGFIDMKVAEREPGTRVKWEVVGGPDAWIGTTVAFDLAPDDGDTVVMFRHQGWKEPSEFMHHCSTKWATFLMSLKSSVETGCGAPFPHDVHISNKGD
jgi:uncharacterized protein YndB with AHSA1/START domain